MSSLFIFSLVVVVVQVCYLFLFLVAFLQKEKPSSATPVPVSVIVCAHDEEDNLRALVPLILKQEYPEFELIVIEDRCNDGTYDYLLKATKEHDRLKMVRVTSKPEHVNGKKFGLTLGIKAARYEWVLFTDADCRPLSNQWIMQMMKSRAEETQIILGFSPYQKWSGLLNSFIRFETLLTGIQFIGMALLGKPYMGVGRNLAYRKSLFLDNKGFNTMLSITGGDDDLFVNKHATRSNTTVSLGAQALVLSTPKKSWKEFWGQKHRHLSVGKKYRFLDRVLLGSLSLSWIAFWLIVVPVAVTGSIPIGLIIALVIRLILLPILFKVACKRLEVGFELWKIPFLDFIYAFYYLVAGVRALVVKKVRWKS